MFRLAVVLSVIALSAATPPVSRSREEILEFRNFLESTKNDDGQYVQRVQENPEANAEELSGKYQGDIVLDDFMIDSILSQYAAGRNAYTWPNTKWPENTVIWDYGTTTLTDAQRDAIEAGIKDIEDNSCIRFRKRNGESNFVSITNQNNGCYANVGFWGSRGSHTYNLAPNTPGNGCFRHATIVHEWLHILGFFHMQSTYNRDDYVRIAVENVQAGSLHNFDIYDASLVSNLGVEYDYVSCLHYGAYGFSINGLPTIVALQEHEGTMGQREYITEKDWIRLNRHYNCPGAWD